jgi:hypothetical protein
MPYRLTLNQDLPNRAPAALTVTITYRNGAAPTVWPVQAVGTDRDVAVITVNCAHNLLNVPNAATRTLNAHYPTPPTQMDIGISSIQLPSLLSGQARPQEESGMPDTPYAVNITMTQPTVQALQSNKYILYAFKAVRSVGQGAPVVWFQTTDYGKDTAVSWTEQYQAFTSTSQIIPNGVVVASNSYPIGLQQTLNVTDPSGIGEVDATTGTPDAIVIDNETSTQLTCGISQTDPQGHPAPMCAFPLFGNGLDVIAPIEKVAFMFAQLPVDTGTVVEQSYGQGILIDLTENNSQAVAYDINAGWSWGGGPWAQTLPPSTNLVPFLIQSSGRLVRQYLAAASRTAA